MKVKRKRDWRRAAEQATGEDRPDYQCKPGESGCVGCVARGDRILYRGVRFTVGDSGQLIDPDGKTVYMPGQAMPEGKDINARGLWALVDRWIDRR